MINHYKIAQGQKRSKSEARVKSILYPKRDTLRHQQLALASLTRKDEWAREKTQDEDTMNTLKKGATPIVGPGQYKFRARDSSKDLHEKEFNIFCRFKTAVERAESAEKDYKQSHLEPVPFGSLKLILDPVREKHKELGPSMRFGPRTENERLANHLDGISRWCDPAPRSDSMLLDPKWKEDEKSKWVSQRNFDLTTCHYRGKKSKEPWEIIEVKMDQPEPYLDGHETTGNIFRKRQRKLETSSKQFMTPSTVCRDLDTTLPRIRPSVGRTENSEIFHKIEELRSSKIYPQTAAHIMSNLDTKEDLNSTNGSISKPFPIRGQVLGTLAPLKESSVKILYNANSMLSSESPTVKLNKSPSKTTKNFRRNIRQNLEQTIKTYFD